MHVERSNEFGRLDEARLRVFAAEIGARLPDDYRAFLLEHNGGLPVPSDFSLGAGHGDSTLHHTYGLHAGPEYFRLDDTYEVYRGRLPASLLAIADDSSGNAICIGLRGEERAKVYFWDHEGESDPPTWDNVIELAPSFAAFCDTLFDFGGAAG